MGIWNDIDDIPNDISKLANNFRYSTSYNTQSINGNSVVVLYANSVLQYTINKSIEYSDRGRIVKDLEYVLNSLGYKTYSTPLPDGIFGNRVLSAVKSIQVKNGILNNGIVNNITAKILYDLVLNDMKGNILSSNQHNKYANSRIPNTNKVKPVNKNDMFSKIEKNIKKYWWIPAILLVFSLLIDK